MAAPVAPELPSITLGDRYDVQRLLGRGGMGSVYLARDRRLDRPVAIKVLSADVADDPGLRERFVREVRTAASFSHPNIVPVFGVEDSDGALACVMGFVEGESLADRVARGGPLPARELVRILLDVAYALAYAHQREVVHRDLKPDNVMLERATGRALLMDFGIARRITATPAAGLTRVGEVVGTPAYMSPEQIAGDAVDGRSDLYSLGLVAWYAATATSAMDAPTGMQILTRQLTELPPPLSSVRPDLPAALCDVVDACVAKERDDRPADAKALVEALERAQEAAPEIPLHVRLFAQELGAVSLVVIFVSLLLVTYLASASEQLARGNLNALVLAVAIVAVIITRVLQTASELRTFARDGWTRADVHAALAAVLDERSALRAQLGSDPRAQASRRRTVRVGFVMLGIGIASILAASLVTRAMARPGWAGIGSLTLAFNGFACIAVALPLWLRNPLRVGLPERLFRLYWIGFPGRALFRLAWPRQDATPAMAPMRATGTPPPRSRMPTPARRATAPLMPTPLPAPDLAAPVDAPVVRADIDGMTRLATLLDALEQRVAALERVPRT